MKRLRIFFMFFGVYAIGLCCVERIGSAEEKTAPASEQSAVAAVPNWDSTAQDITYSSSLDGAVCHAVFYNPNVAEEAPLLVALHTWGQNYLSTQSSPGNNYLLECKSRGWLMIHPDFRGPNRNSNACASPLAIQDVIDAITYVSTKAKINQRRIYLAGFSGGGHIALVMAAKHPEVWAAVSAWAGITELDKWYNQLPTTNPTLNGYRLNLEAICGGPPQASYLAEYQARSPLTFLDAAKGLHLEIEVGVMDGVVPSSHSMYAFNLLARANGFAQKCLTDAEINATVSTKKIPQSMLDNNETLDQTGRTKLALFCRTTGPSRIVFHSGAHEIENAAAINWLSQFEKPGPSAPMMQSH